MEGADPDPRERAVAARAAARGVGARRDGLRRAHPALRRAVRLPAGRGRPSSSPSRTSPGWSGTSARCAPPRTPRWPRSPRRSRTPRRSATWCRASSSSTTPSTGRAPRRGARSRWPRSATCPPARRSAPSSSVSWPGCDRPDRPRRVEVPAVPRSADELVELLDLETIDINLFRGIQPRHDPAAGLRRPGGRAGAGRGRAHRGRRARRALPAQLLPAARRHRGADRVRRRAGPRRTVLLRPAASRPASTAGRSTT